MQLNSEQRLKLFKKILVPGVSQTSISNMVFSYFYRLVDQKIEEKTPKDVFTAELLSYYELLVDADTGLVDNLLHFVRGNYFLVTLNELLQSEDLNLHLKWITILKSYLKKVKPNDEKLSSVMASFSLRAKDKFKTYNKEISLQYMNLFEVYLKSDYYRKNKNSWGFDKITKEAVKNNLNRVKELERQSKK